jgi:tetratricopeptide (TPR) repeat protein
MTFDSPRSRRLAALAALALFWAILLLAVGVPRVAIAFVALAAGVAAVLALGGGSAARWLGSRARGIAGGAQLVRARSPGARNFRRRAAHVASRSRDDLRRARRGAGHSIRGARRALGGLEAGRRARGAGAVVGTLVGRANEVRTAVAARSRPDPRVKAWRMNQMSANLRAQGRTAEALERSEAALALFRELDDRRGQALTLNTMGLALARRGDVDAAAARFEEALELLAWLGDRHGEGQVMANLGALNRRQGHEEQARAYWRDALARLDPDSPERERIAEQLQLAS